MMVLKTFLFINQHLVHLFLRKSGQYVIAWKPEEFLKSQLLLLHGAFLPNTKFFVYKIRKQENKTPLIVVQNNYTTKTVNAYIVYDINNWPRNLRNNFKLKIYLFGAANIVKIATKVKICVVIWNSIGWSRFMGFS